MKSDALYRDGCTLDGDDKMVVKGLRLMCDGGELVVCTHVHVYTCKYRSG